MLQQNIASQFFDHFEEVTLAVIMSYTTIECLANSCIPFYHKHTAIKKGNPTIYNKDSIEREFHLRDKLKTVIPPILKTTSPVSQSWWQTFISLEKLRNEIIHAKKSMAESRYSTLIHEKIFETASIHNTVVSYYASLLCDSKSSIINEFPTGIGFDEMIPALMTNENFDKSYKHLFNIK